jgi:hypothetical protein
MMLLSLGSVPQGPALRYLLQRKALGFWFSTGRLEVVHPHFLEVLSMLAAVRGNR